MNYSVILLFFTFVSAYNADAKVDPPNFDFKYTDLDVFRPGSNSKQIIEKHGKGEVMSLKKEEKLSIVKYYINHQRYKFPVFVQLHNGTVLDYFAKLPSYFLHDVFHQSIINKIGVQDKFFKQEENSVYIWSNKKGLKHIYSGTCTITCFPLYYSVITLTPPKGLEAYKSVIEQFFPAPD